MDRKIGQTTMNMFLLWLKQLSSFWKQVSTEEEKDAIVAKAAQLDFGK